MSERPSLREFLMYSAGFAANWFNQHGGLYAQFALAHADGDVTIMPGDFCDTDQDQGLSKDLTALALRAIISQRRVDRVVWMAEAWIVLPTDGAMPTGPLRHHPDRIEAVYLNAQERNGETIEAYYAITRPVGGAPQLSPLQFLPTAPSAGRFANLFNPISPDDILAVIH